MSVRLVLTITDLTRGGSVVEDLTVLNIIAGLEGHGLDAMRSADEVVLVLKSRLPGRGLEAGALELDAAGSVIASTKSVPTRDAMWARRNKRRDDDVAREIQRALGTTKEVIDLGPPLFDWTRAVRHLSTGIRVRREIPNDDGSRLKWRVLPSEHLDEPIIVSDITARDWMVVDDTGNGSTQ